MSIENIGLQKIVLDISKKFTQKTFYANEVDTNGRGFHAFLKNNGVTVDGTGVTLRFRYTSLNDGQAKTFDFEHLGEHTNGEFEFHYPTEMVRGFGGKLFPCTIVASDANSEIAFENIFVYINKAEVPTEGIEASNEFSTLEIALAKVDAMNLTFDEKVVLWDSAVADEIATWGTAFQVKYDNLEVEYAEDLTEVKTSLAQKATKGEITSADLKILNESDRLGLQNLKEEVIQAMAGSTPVNSIPSDKSVSPIKTSFFEEIKAKNMINPSAVVNGYYVSETTGAFSANASYKRTDYIPVKAGTHVFSCGDANIAFRFALYDNSKVFLSGALDTPLIASGKSWLNTSYKIITIPQDGFIVMSFLAPTNYLQLELTTHTIYEAYYAPYYVFDADLIKDNTLTSDKVQDGALTREKTDFVTLGKNLFDKSTITAGHYVGEAVGTLTVNAAHTSSDFIPVEDATKYAFLSDANSRIAYYNSSKDFISGALNPTIPITTPASAAFVRISFVHAAISADLLQFEKGESKTSYENFGYKFVKSTTNDALVIPSEIILPKKIYCLVGKEMNIYFDNIVSGKDTDYSFDVVCGKGQQLDHVWRFIPDVAESRPITINVYKLGALVSSVTSTLIIKGVSVGNGVTKKLLIIGDSTTANGFMVGKLRINYTGDVMGLTMIGTKGVAPNQHEGLSGWTSAMIVNDVTSPLVFSGSFNFAQYIATNSMATPDYVMINLGINDILGSLYDVVTEANMNSFIANYNTMINSIKAFNSSIKILIGLTIPPNYNQDAFAKDYRSYQSRYGYKQNNFRWVKKLLEIFDGREAESIYVVPLNLNLDTRYNFGFETIPVNARNSRMIESPAPNSGVHPVESGYWQIADVYWYWLKGQEV